jgi:hypothetical protein
LAACEQTSLDAQYRKNVSLSVGVGFDVPKILTPKPAKPKKTVKEVSDSGVIGRQPELATALNEGIGVSDGICTHRPQR